MLMTVFTVIVLAVTVIMLVVMNRFVAVVLLLETECHSGLVPCCHMEPVLLLKLPSGLVPLFFHLGQSSSDKVLLLGGREEAMRREEAMKHVELNQKQNYQHL